MNCAHTHLLRTHDGLTQCMGCEAYVNDHGDPVNVLVGSKKAKKKRKFIRPVSDDE